MGVMTRVGAPAWEQLGGGSDFTRCLHSVGDLDPKKRFICHFPLDNTVWSYGSGYGGNALLGKKCLALRLASYTGYQQGWLAEHMLLMGVTSPGGEKTYLAGAFPSPSGKSNFASLVRPATYRRPGRRTGLGHHFRRPAQRHGTPRLPGLQLDPRRLPRRHARLGDDGGGRGTSRRRPPRPDGDAPLPRLQHQRLLAALAAHAQA